MERSTKRAIFVTLMTNALAARATTSDEFRVAHEGATELGKVAFPLLEGEADALTPEGEGTERGDVTLTLHQDGAQAATVEASDQADGAQGDGAAPQ